MEKKGQTTAKQVRKANVADMVQSQVMPLADIYPNKGQIPGVPKNPRLINDDKFKLLKRSIEEDPEMLGLREILVYRHNGKYIIIGGNMRFRALKELGYVEAIVKVLPESISTDKLRAIVIKDNSGFGEWDWNELANVWDANDLVNWGVDVPELDNATVEEEEAEEDDFSVEEHLPKKAKAKFGDIYALGKHRLICGDSTDGETVSLLVGDSKVDLLLTDPPYNVDYSSKNEALNAADEGNRIQKDIANDKMEGDQFQDFLTAAFTNASYHLKPGGAFYIWHADSEGLNFIMAIKRSELNLKQTIIWNKNSFVLGRQDYQRKHEQCQPAGTKVRTPNGEIPIEELKDGDRVISYDKYAGVIKGFKDGLAIKKASRHYTGEIYGIEVGNRKTWATDNHRFTVRFHDAGRKIWCVYLMKRGRTWWRVGITETYNSRGLGLKQRMRQENADEAWILKTFNTRAEAQCYEQIAAVKYGIPYTYWEVDSKPVPNGYVIRTKEQIEWIYSHFDEYELRGKAETLLRAFGRRIEYPLITRENRDHHLSTRVTTDVRACNLIPHIMELPIPYDKYEGTHTFEWKPITDVERKAYDGTVYSLQVEKYEHYIADGIVTHNCLYGWKPGAGHYFIDNRSQQTVTEDGMPDFDRMTKDEMKKMLQYIFTLPSTVIDENKPLRSEDHPTMKPLKLMGRLIRNSTRPGEVVLDLFGGSGSTLMAAEQLGRVCYMVELDPCYIDVIIKRWEEYTGEKAKYLGNCAKEGNTEQKE